MVQIRNSHIKKLILSSILLKPEAKEHWLAKVDTLSDGQCAKVEKALISSEEGLKFIIQKPENQVKLQKTQEELDHILKIYITDVEKASTSTESQTADSLLDNI